MSVYLILWTIGAVIPKLSWPQPKTGSYIDRPTQMVAVIY